MAARTPLDSDMWWHMRAGEETLKSGSPITVDTLSHTRMGEPWVNHSWLSQVVLFMLYQTGGFFALGAVVALLAALSFGLVYLQMDGPALLRAFVIILAVPVAAMVWSARPQVVSLVLFGLVGTILFLYKWHHRNYLWTLLIIFVLWSNLHGGYVLGLLLIGSMIIGEIINRVLFRTGKEVLGWKQIGWLTLWGFLAGLVVVINPNGLAMWMIPFKTVGVGVLQELISEWASPDFHQLVQQPFLWLLFATLGIAGLSKRRLDGSDLVSVVGFAYLALLARRNYGPFAMVAAPVLSRHLTTLLSEWRIQAEDEMSGAFVRIRNLSQKFDQRSLSPGIKKVINASIIILLSTVALLKLYAVTEPVFVDKYLKEIFPVEAVKWINENQPAGELFNEYNWGGYLTWELRDYPVFVDGRTDLYDNEVLMEYLEIQAGRVGWEETLKEYSVKVVLVEVNSGLAHSLSSNQRWRWAYGDEKAVVFVRVDND